MDWNCFVFFSCFFPVPFSCLFPVFVPVFFMFLFTVSGTCFFVLPLFSSSCHALSDVLPHFSNPGFPILRLVSAKHSCKSTGHSISGPRSKQDPYAESEQKNTGKEHASTQKGKRPRKKAGKKQENGTRKKLVKNRTPSEQPQTTTEICKNEQKLELLLFFTYCLPVVYLFVSFFFPVVFPVFSCCLPVFSCSFPVFSPVVFVVLFSSS